MPTFITNLPISIKMLMTFVVILVISLALNIVSFLCYAHVIQMYPALPLLPHL